MLITQIVPAAFDSGQRISVRSLSSGEGLHWIPPEAKPHLLLDAKCSSERMEPREISIVLRI